MPSTRFPLLLLMLVAALLLAGCGDDKVTLVTPSTPIEFVNAAAAKTQGVQSYRLNYASQVTGSGMREPVKETLKGDFYAEDALYRYTGPANQSIQLDGDDEVQVAIVDGKSYVHGPVAAWGAPEDRWYIYSINSEAQLTPPSRLNLLIELLARRDLRLEFVKAGSEQLGSLSCERYNAEHDTAIAVINELSHPSTLTDVQQTIVTATPESYVSVWVCPDGYIHQIDIDVHGTDPNELEQGYKLRLELSEVDAVPAITAPPDAIDVVR
jgi:uncharacterized lipoprotein YajG